MKLNEANLAVWYEILKDDKLKEISNKLLLCDASEGTLSDSEIKEYLKIEKKAINEAKKKILENNNITKKIYEYIDILKEENNENLKVIFSNKVLNDFSDGKINSVDEVDDLYHNIRKKYLTLETHNELNEKYNKSTEMTLEDIINEKSKVLDGDNKKEVEKVEHNFHYTTDVKWEPVDLSSILNSLSGSDIYSNNTLNIINKPQKLEEIYTTNIPPKEISKMVYETNINDKEWDECSKLSKKEKWDSGNVQENITELLVYIRRFEKLLGI